MKRVTIRFKKAPSINRLNEVMSRLGVKPTEFLHHRRALVVRIEPEREQFLVDQLTEAFGDLYRQDGDVMRPSLQRGKFTPPAAVRGLERRVL